MSVSYLNLPGQGFRCALHRLARAETLHLRNADYIVAVQLQGASSTRVILRHIVPMCLSSVIVRLTMNMAGIILTAAVRSYCDCVMVMYAGRVVESIRASDFDQAQHPYTRGPLAALLSISERRERLAVLQRDPSWLTV